MTRQETIDQYGIDAHGMIASLGKFESEPCFVPHFWEASLDGSAETLDWPGETTSYLVDVDQSDRAEYPEIPADAIAVHMAESDTGFVDCECLAQAQVDELHARNDSDWEAYQSEHDDDSDA